MKNAITILHTNDFHNGLKPEGAERLRALKAEQPDTLLLDAGDIIKTGNIGIPLSEEPVWKLMALAGYDAAAMGNREFHVSEMGIKAKLRGAPCPILCANMVDKTDQSLPLAPYARFLLGETRVIALGLTVPMVTPKMKTQAISRYLFAQPIEAAAEFAPKLRPECDLLIALTHIGHRNDQKLAEAVPLFDLIIGGHSHTVLEQPERIGQTTIVQTGSHGRFVGRLRISASKEIEGELLPLKN